MIFLYIIVGLFALLGLWTFVRGVCNWWRKIIGTANDLASTLKDATEIARAYREDLSILRQIAQSGPERQVSDDPDSIIPQHRESIESTMPAPYWGRYPVKPEEPDAPPESDVDRTATDEELIEQERNEASTIFEMSERQKAEIRDADQARIKEIVDMSAKSEEK